MAKLGRLFENLVGDVVQEIDPEAKVFVGEWLNGPDGLREIDVLVEGYRSGRPIRLQIECKDYKPGSRKIGISVVDAVDSKHRDLKLDMSLICSNAGFSIDAIRKAKRLNIGLVGVSRRGDKRNKYALIDEIYTRRVKYIPLDPYIRVGVLGSAPKSIDLEVLCYENLPVRNWLEHRVSLFLQENPVVSGTHELEYAFIEPVPCNLKEFSIYTGKYNIFLEKLTIRFKLSGVWVAQKIEIDATSILYDWIKKRLRISSEPGSVTLKDFKIGAGGKIINTHPLAHEWENSRNFVEREMEIQMFELENFPFHESRPNLDVYLPDNWKEKINKNMELSSYVSDKNYRY